MKFTQYIPFFVATILVISSSTAYSQNTVLQNNNRGAVEVSPNRSIKNDAPRLPASSYPQRLCSVPYFCQPFPSDDPHTVCKLYVSQGPNGPLYFYRCRRYEP